MDRKKKKSAILIMLSLILSTAGCKQDDTYKNNSYNIVEEIIDNNPFYQEYHLSQTYKQIYSPFYHTYLNQFFDYLNKEQYNTFLNIIREMDEAEINDYDYNKTIDYLDKIMGCQNNQYGRGVYHAFNARIVYENVYLSYKFNTDIYKEINTLRSIINNDDAFFSSLFSKDIDKFIECIQNNTGLENKDLIQALIVNMDLYYDIESKEETIFIEFKEDYCKQIKNIMSTLVKSKLTTDQKFANTLYGKILKNSNYTEDSYTSKAIQELLGDETEFYLSSEKYHESYNFSLSSEYLYSNISLSKVKNLKVTEIIDKADIEDNTYYRDTMTIMIHLIDPDIFLGQHSPSTKRKLMYENLKEYFKNIEEFDEFFLIVSCDSPKRKIWDIYFNIFNLRIKEDGITIDDFTRYTSLANLINDHKFIFYHWDSDDGHYPEKEIENLPKEEAEKIVTTTTSNNRLLSRMRNCKEYLTMTENILKENDLGYEMVYNPDCKFEYRYGIIVVKDDSNCVISQSIEPKSGRYNGINIIYYEIPKYFEEGRAITAFNNIENRLTISEIEGLKENFFDEISQKEVNGFIVKINPQEKEEYQPIRFMEYYMHFAEKRIHKNKEYTLEIKQ